LSDSISLGKGFWLEDLPLMSRRRQILKWLGLIVCVVLGVVWAVSIRYLIRYDSKNLECVVYSGCLQVTTPNPLNSRGLAIHRKSFNELLLWGEFSKVSAGGRTFRSARIPIWMPFLPLAIITRVLWRRGHRPTTKCPHCEYDLRGNESGICSECGKKIDESTVNKLKGNKPK
jgi:hypothetical protein